MSTKPTTDVHSHDHISFLSVNGEILFFQHFDGPYFPTLKLLHKCKCLEVKEGILVGKPSLCRSIDPDILPKLQVDRGAIKFVLSGANIMCPGLTSKGARMDVDLPAETMVAIMAEGKEHALAIGWLKMSTDEM